MCRHGFIVLVGLAYPTNETDIIALFACAGGAGDAVGGMPSCGEEMLWQQVLVERVRE